MPDRPFDSLTARRETDDDARLQRLADLSIEIRMLKARAQVGIDDHPSFRSPLIGASCPYCGHSAGLALLPREYRRPTTPVRCFACRRDATAGDWAMATPPVTPPRSAGNALSSRNGR